MSYSNEVIFISVVGISTKGNKEQEELCRLIMDNSHPIILATGSAGTGKTLISLATALELQQQKKYKKILFGRNPVQLGEEMGFLPGDVGDKYGPFMGPLYDNLEVIEKYNKGKVSVSDLKRRIECTPISFLRGRSIDNAVLIIDEAQNLDAVTLRTILTRVGKYSKVVLLGSMNQIDDVKQKKKEKCDFQQVIDRLVSLPFVAHVELTKSMRSEWCATIDELLRDMI